MYIVYPDGEQLIKFIVWLDGIKYHEIKRPKFNFHDYTIYILLSEELFLLKQCIHCNINSKHFVCSIIFFRLTHPWHLEILLMNKQI